MVTLILKQTPEWNLVYFRFFAWKISMRPRQQNINFQISSSVGVYQFIAEFSNMKITVDIFKFNLL